MTAVGKGETPGGWHDRALDVKVGDRVLLGKYAGSEVKLAMVRML